jgi:hypothetical protein
VRVLAAGAIIGAPALRALAKPGASDRGDRDDEGSV